MPRTYSVPVHSRDLPWWGYDLAIGVMLLLGVLTAGLWAFLGHYGIAALCAAALSVILYGSFIEPRLLRVRRYSVGKGERVLKVAFLSDIHVGPYKGTAWVRRVARMTNALQPDLVLLGGDYLYAQARDLWKLAPLKELKGSLGVYAILGNHDEWRAIKESKAWFESAGLPLLLNRSMRVEKEGMGITIAGADDDWYGETDLASTFKDARPDDLIIAMLHNPDLAPPAAELLVGRTAEKTVFFSGHAHGGQICLPFIGPIPHMQHQLGRKYARGLFNFHGVSLVIGTGLGESGPRARLFCPPEIVLTEVRF